MRDDSDDHRDAIHATIQERGPSAAFDGAAVLVGWALVCEWMDESGDRWLSKCHSSSIAYWTAGGMHHEALHGQWPDDEDDE